MTSMEEFCSDIDSGWGPIQGDTGDLAPCFEAVVLQWPWCLFMLIVGSYTLCHTWRIDHSQTLASLSTQSKTNVLWLSFSVCLYLFICVGISVLISPSYPKFIWVTFLLQGVSWAFSCWLLLSEFRRTDRPGRTLKIYWVLFSLAQIKVLQGYLYREFLGIHELPQSLFIIQCIFLAFLIPFDVIAICNLYMGPGSLPLPAPSLLLQEGDTEDITDVTKERSLGSQHWKRWMSYNTNPSERERDHKESDRSAAENSTLITIYPDSGVQTITVGNWFWGESRQRRVVHYLVTGATTDGKTFSVWRKLKDFKKLRKLVFKESQLSNMEPPVWDVASEPPDAVLAGLNNFVEPLGGVKNYRGILNRFTDIHNNKRDDRMSRDSSPAFSTSALSRRSTDYDRLPDRPSRFSQDSNPKYDASPQIKTVVLDLNTEDTPSPAQEKKVEVKIESEDIEVVLLAASIIGRSEDENGKTKWEIQLSSADDTWSIFRRFSELRTFAADLRMHHPQEPLPRFPSRQRHIGNQQSDEFLDKRQELVEIWLQGLIGMQHLQDEFMLSFFQVHGYNYSRQTSLDSAVSDDILATPTLNKKIPPKKRKKELESRDVPSPVRKPTMDLHRFEGKLMKWAIEEDESSFILYTFEMREFFSKTDCMVWSIGKRYTDFTGLAAQLEKTHPGSVPALPPKGVTATSSHEDIEKRAKRLEIFLRQILSISLFKQNVSVMNFLDYNKPDRQVTVEAVTTFDPNAFF